MPTGNRENLLQRNDNLRGSNITNDNFGVYVQNRCQFDGDKYIFSKENVFNPQPSIYLKLYNTIFERKKKILINYHLF
jgi:hypothetical protein